MGDMLAPKVDPSLRSVGLFGVVNAVTEWVAGSKGAIDGRYVLAVVLGILASVLLLGAGSRSSPASAGSAPRAVRVSRQYRGGPTVVPLDVLLSPNRWLWLPVALLIALYRPRKATPSAAV